MKSKSFFPLYVNLEGKLAVVVGGGKIATRRVKALSPVSYTHLDVYKRQVVPCPMNTSTSSS